MSKLTVLTFFTMIGLTNSTFAEPPKVERKNDHVMPVYVEITEKDPKVKPLKVLLTMVSEDIWIHGDGFQMKVYDGSKSVLVWIDSIKEINQIDSKKLCIIFQNGEERDFSYDERTQLVYFNQLLDTKGEVLLKNCKSVKFLKTPKSPRADKDGHAMANDWRYSPYTGEKLKQIEE
jgi:hypothetical protein